jgi:hypothetical protein
MTEPDHIAALRVPDAPSIPLARTVAMPEHLDFPTGTLHFRLTDLELHPAGTPAGTTLPPFDVTAGYVVEATRDDIATHDGGGDLSELPASATAPNDGYRPTDDDREQWLSLARDHQTRLGNIDLPNSRNLLGTFDQHNETYAALFEPTSDFVDNVWRVDAAPDTTAQLSRDTHAAVRGNSTINPKSDQRTYLDWKGQEATYNAVSWERYTGVLTYLPYLRAEFAPGRADAVSQDVNDAIKATKAFALNVTANTGNKSDTTVAMTSDSVYKTVVEGAPAPGAAERDWSEAVLNPFDDDVWEGWDDDERDLIREHHRAALRSRAARVARAQPTALFTGTCTARVANAAVTAGGDRVEVTVPALELAIDDSAWSGAAADVARERLGDLGFLADLVRDAIRERLRRAAVEGDPRVGGSPDR